MRRLLLAAAGLWACLLCLASAPGPAGAPDGVKYGPWVSGVRENSVTILWVSEQPGMAWVELPDGTCRYQTYAGRRVFGRLHSISLEGLAAGSVLRYRVCGQTLTDDSNARQPVFGGTYAGEWHGVRTFDASAPTCHFSVFNDIHLRVADYADLAAQVDSAGTDFLFLNGDIASAGNYVLDSLVRYEVAPLGTLPAGIPLLFARGNHEGRGNNLPLVADIFPSGAAAPFYYTFRSGPVAFVVFDGGETGQSRARLFSGGDVYEDYLNEQLAWAQEALQEPLFADAPLKVCLLHVPMIDHPDQDDYLLQRWLNRHFIDLLNGAGINLMIGADLHEFMYCEPGTMGNAFPILVNDDDRRLDVSCSPDGITLKMFNHRGGLEFEKTLKF